MTATSEGAVHIDALFELACGCVLDGCSTSSPGRALFGPHDWWTSQGLEPPAAEPNHWMLLCTETRGHGWQTITAAVSLASPRPVFPVGDTDEKENR